MKEQIKKLVESALGGLPEETLPAGELPGNWVVERTRDRQHGDFACNIAMILARIAKRKPRELAEQIVAGLENSPLIAKVEVAGPGFINFFLAPEAYHQVVAGILSDADAYGRSELGKDRSVNVEFVSANPTGPLHVGHGRLAAYGATVANLLETVGYEVHREYYVNDAGRQMDILAASVWLRYLETGGASLNFPSNAYRGAYVHDIATGLREKHGELFDRAVGELMRDIPPDAPEGDKETHIDAIIARAKTLLEEKDYRLVFDAALNSIMADIRDDLARFGAVVDEWFSERSLTEGDLVQHAINKLQQHGDIYKKDGALWFAAEKYGDEKDRVVRRENGSTTYFASDIAYMLNKRERGADHLIYILGADHHGYIARLKAGMQAFSEDPDSVEVRLVQFAVLYRGGEKVQMSTRSGEFVTLRDLREEVGNDAARFFYVLRSNEQHLDFDLELAKSHSNDNPVYYIQYAHARVCSVFKQLQDKGYTWRQSDEVNNLQRLDTSHEEALMVALARYPEIVELAALGRAPHHIAHYLRDLANDFHTYYNAHTFIVDDEALRNARLTLIHAVRQVLANGLALLGVSAPESM